jgi:hypothetical protein
LKRNKRCERCKYRGSWHHEFYGVNECDYIVLTGQSRLKAAYQSAGVDRVTKEVQELLRPENCTFFVTGKRKAK